MGARSEPCNAKRLLLRGLHAKAALLYGCINDQHNRREDGEQYKQNDPNAQPREQRSWPEFAARSSFAVRIGRSERCADRLRCRKLAHSKGSLAIVSQNSFVNSNARPMCSLFTGLVT